MKKDTTIPAVPLDNRAGKPGWLKVQAPGSEKYLQTRQIVKTHELHTVCEQARCPNIGECWSHSTATFLIMGDLCSRNCRFCAVQKSRGQSLPPLDTAEPSRVASAVAELGLKHAVITSVTRDDLPDGGAGHFAETVRSIRNTSGDCKIEVLVPDFGGSFDSISMVMESGVDILNHNLETVPRLYGKVRPEAIYERSLNLLKTAKELSPCSRTKSGIMVGLGEENEEVFSVMKDLRSVGTDIMTLGQYLRPSAEQIPVARWVAPEEFAEYEAKGLELGFAFVESKPLVRSSYHAWKHSSSGKLGLARI